MILRNPIARLGLFAAILVAVFFAGLGIGRATGPFDEPVPPVHMEHRAP